MPIPLHLDSNLTVAQQVFVAGIPPEPPSLGNHVLSAGLTSLTMVAAATLIARSSAPETVPPVLFRLAMVGVWIRATVPVVFLFVMWSGRYFIASIIDQETSGDMGGMDTANRREHMIETLSIYIDESPFASARRFINRFAVAGMVVGLAMSGFVVLAFAVALAWGTSWFARRYWRSVMVGVVRFLCPDEDGGAGDAVKVAA